MKIKIMDLKSAAAGAFNKTEIDVFEKMETMEEFLKYKLIQLKVEIDSCTTKNSSENIHCWNLINNFLGKNNYEHGYNQIAVDWLKNNLPNVIDEIPTKFKGLI